MPVSDLQKRLLRRAVNYHYDLQKLRVSSANRANRMVPTTELTEVDKAFLEKMSEGMEELEADALSEVKRHLKGIPIYEEWLRRRPDQKGCGPTMAGLIISYFNIERCDTASKMWAFAGLAVRDGHADRRAKGEKAKYNPFLKAKMVKVLGECLIKANSPWRSFYDNYKTRKTNTRVEVCMGCEGAGVVALREEEATGPNGKKQRNKKTPCKNCGGTGGPAPWGRSDAHRHQAAVRYMVKMFLLGCWREWRQLEGLPVREPYAVEYLGREHHENEPRPNGQPKKRSEPSDVDLDAEVDAELRQEAAL